MITPDDNFELQKTYGIPKLLSITNLKAVKRFYSCQVVGMCIKTLQFALFTKHSISSRMVATKSKSREGYK